MKRVIDALVMVNNEAIFVVPNSVFVSDDMVEVSMHPTSDSVDEETKEVSEGSLSKIKKWHRNGDKNLLMMNFFEDPDREAKSICRSMEVESASLDILCLTSSIKVVMRLK